MEVVLVIFIAISVALSVVNYLILMSVDRGQIKIFSEIIRLKEDK